MRGAIPPMTEPMDHLKHRLQREHDGHKQPRLQMLFVLASGQPPHQDVAQIPRSPSERSSMSSTGSPSMAPWSRSRATGSSLNGHI